MKVFETDLPGVLVFDPLVHGDERGYFMETYRADDFSAHGVAGPFVQDNQSSSARGVLRGLHYQISRAQGKLVRVLSGRVFDVAVDLRKSSPTCGRWAGVELSGDNKRQLWVPPGFGHGFLVLSESAEFFYKCTDYYAPEHERVIAWNDPELDIAWPVTTGMTVTVSDKDREGVAFSAAQLYP